MSEYDCLEAKKVTGTGIPNQGLSSETFTFWMYVRPLFAGIKSMLLFFSILIPLCLVLLMNKDLIVDCCVKC